MERIEVYISGTFHYEGQLVIVFRDCDNHDLIGIDWGERHYSGVMAFMAHGGSNPREQLIVKHSPDHAINDRDLHEIEGIQTLLGNPDLDMEVWGSLFE